ncbi:hypothetical protein E1B28_009539 [Marasmius oreades]|uniref:Uncharacterized protein n=1 Tax=Marasmius oreades TaxID=181124 RepID=A0A9P7RVH9_9AGAR|nr:uncharacterized protein E1B28_009539 [Marasmius oreades]KAG7090420.1 hypothetical protein E1B28_009539 [Marasmius oreades]
MGVLLKSSKSCLQRSNDQARQRMKPQRVGSYRKKEDSQKVWPLATSTKLSANPTVTLMSYSMVPTTSQLDDDDALSVADRSSEISFESWLLQDNKSDDGEGDGDDWSSQSSEEYEILPDSDEEDKGNNGKCGGTDDELLPILAYILTGKSWLNTDVLGTSILKAF